MAVCGTEWRCGGTMPNWMLVVFPESGKTEKKQLSAGEDRCCFRPAKFEEPVKHLQGPE